MRSAVFVDAGYLYAQGSAALAGSRLGREHVHLNTSAAVEKLTKAVETIGAPLLRIYWYDGQRDGKLSLSQQELADTENVKLRLGVINIYGKQKGVDSLIVTDLVELARNRAISDAILLSGDEDLRIGVEIAQSLGVRVHLIGVVGEPGRSSQSSALLREADTTTQWSKADIGGVMTVVTERTGLPRESSHRSPVAISDSLEQAFSVFASSLGDDEARIIAGLGERVPVPGEVDGRLLAACRRAMGRKLTDDERAWMRAAFKRHMRERLSNL